MSALNLPSAADIERLTRRLRSVSQRLEGIEDAVDRIDERLASAGSRSGAGELADLTDRLDGRIDELARDIAAIRAAVVPPDEVPPRAQERLTVSDGPQAWSRRASAVQAVSPGARPISAAASKLARTRPSSVSRSVTATTHPARTPWRATVCSTA